MLQPFVVNPYMTGPGVLLCIGEVVIIIDGSQDICSQDFSQNGFEVFFVMESVIAITYATGWTDA